MVLAPGLENSALSSTLRLQDRLIQTLSHANSTAHELFIARSLSSPTFQDFVGNDSLLPAVLFVFYVSIVNCLRDQTDFFIANAESTTQSLKSLWYMSNGTESGCGSASESKMNTTLRSMNLVISHPDATRSIRGGGRVSQRRPSPCCVISITRSCHTHCILLQGIQVAANGRVLANRRIRRSGVLHYAVDKNYEAERRAFHRLDASIFQIGSRPSQSNFFIGRSDTLNLT